MEIRRDDFIADLLAAQAYSPAKFHAVVSEIDKPLDSHGANITRALPGLHIDSGRGRK